MRTRVIGREAELASIEAFVERVGHGPAALVLLGGSGIGKTALLDVGVERAREAGARIVAYRGTEAEQSLPFAALSDLLAGEIDEALPRLAAPRRRALAAALLLEDPGERPADQRAIGLALLDILRELGGSTPAVVAIDDLQWLDPASAAALRFAFRRLADERVGLLAASRKGARAPIDVEAAFTGQTLERRVIPALSVGAAYRLLSERVGLSMPRPEIVRFHELTGGNPFYLLELGRELKRRDRPLAAGQPVPLPADMRELLAARLSRVPESVQDVLLLVAATARPTIEILEAAGGTAETVRSALEEAARTGVIELGSSRIRFTHPLFASACYQAAPPWRRREVHRLLAGLVAEPEERARHLALAADGPDMAVAWELDRAAQHAVGRGATAAAATFSELAAGATPVARAPESRKRLMRAAASHRLAGDRERAAAILEEVLRHAAGCERADALFELARTRRGDLPSIARLCDEALGEAGGDDARRARILGFLSWIRLITGELDGALAAARDALACAERASDPRLLASAIARVAMAETWTLQITPGLVERGAALERDLSEPLEFHESPTIAFARRLICASELETARGLLEAAASSASERGDEATHVHVLFYLVMLEWFAGRWEAALDYAAAALELAEQLGDYQLRGMVLHGRALVDAHRGDVELARAAAEEAALIAQAVSDALFPIWNAAAVGHVELALGHTDEAVQRLGGLPAKLLALGWNDPADSVWPDAIEAVIAAGELDRADSYLASYEALATRSGSPWALAAAARCAGMLAAARGESQAAFAALERALTEHDRLPGNFERGRTMLALGSARRRARQKAAARAALREAREMFDAVGARLWSVRASEELARISGRRPGSELTASEERVAERAATGQSNKEIAATLFVSVHTVEAHLSRVYRKLGIRSRTELAQRLSTSAPDELAKV
jgi:DNA-binding CsgD family transcriptional regulator